MGQLNRPVASDGPRRLAEACACSAASGLPPPMVRGSFLGVAEEHLCDDDSRRHPFWQIGSSHHSGLLSTVWILSGTLCFSSVHGSPLVASSMRMSTLWARSQGALVC